jgi:hypothetical protein
MDFIVWFFVDILCWGGRRLRVEDFIFWKIKGFEVGAGMGCRIWSCCYNCCVCFDDLHDKKGSLICESQVWSNVG